jgi:predicted AlkP superfamily pyrophosphatase or phosphodiesterase
LLRRYSTPSLVEECEKDGIHLLNNNLPGEARDALSTQAFKFILQKHRPQLALLHISNVDHSQHLNGPRSSAAYTAIKESDAQVGEVWNELKRDFPGKVTLFVVSDHGFSPIKRAILPNVILRQAGLSGEKTKDKKATNSPVQVVVQAGTAMVYILDEINRDMIVEKITKAFRKVKGMRAVIRPDQLNDHGVANPKDDPHAPDMLLFAELGYVFGDTASGDLPFEEKPERKGSHGHDPSIPDLHATFVAWGAGIKPGVRLGEIENTRVAPTIAKLLHVSFPSSVESAPLSAILTE